jgi:hypothetical protein
MRIEAVLFSSISKPGFFHSEAAHHHKVQKIFTRTAYWLSVVFPSGRYLGGRVPGAGEHRGIFFS